MVEIENVIIVKITKILISVKSLDFLKKVIKRLMCGAWRIAFLLQVWGSVAGAVREGFLRPHETAQEWSNHSYPQDNAK